MAGNQRATYKKLKKNIIFGKPLHKLTILQAIQEADAAAKTKGLSFANLQEFNSFSDSFTFLEYPRNVVVPFTFNGQVTENITQDTVAIQGWMLTRIKEDTNDWRSVKLEVDYIAPMRKLARTFIIHLLNSDLTNPQVANVPYTIRPEYMFISHHLFGVSYTMNWPVMGNVCV